jgi:hypothetical protein
MAVVVFCAHDSSMRPVPAASEKSHADIARLQQEVL